MKKYEIRTCDDFDLVIIDILDEIDILDLVGAIKDAVENHLRMNMVFDLTRGGVNTMNVEDIKNYSQTQRERVEKRRGGKTALVSPRPTDRYIFRYFVEMVTLQPDWPIEYLICDSVEEALNWIGANAS